MRCGSQLRGRRDQCWRTFSQNQLSIPAGTRSDASADKRLTHTDLPPGSWVSAITEAGLTHITQFWSCPDSAIPVACRALILDHCGTAANCGLQTAQRRFRSFSRSDSPDRFAAGGHGPGKALWIIRSNVPFANARIQNPRVPWPKSARHTQPGAPRRKSECGNFSLPYLRSRRINAYDFQHALSGEARRFAPTVERPRFRN